MLVVEARVATTFAALKASVLRQRGEAGGEGEGEGEAGGKGEGEGGEDEAGGNAEFRLRYAATGRLVRDETATLKVSAVRGGAGA